ncbi:STAS domain-containing protein [Rubellimicrobium aerolatum]|uniref:STAS domain-containing protein n=1 Tax=Rubellimicrobium aerolatum TaxID=490979 RepID=A0ABW0SGT7_9RHOB|nr:STAS domain-containing protein [Rubellimicrobium aerolatum]MBP1807574.1 chemotaxis protein CheX [Rubellimicrobium aerolatum]
MTILTLDLPERLDLAAVGALAQELLSHRGCPLDVNASTVARIGTPGLQVLLSAARTWRSDGHGFRLSNPSPVIEEAARTLGIELDDLMAEGGAK